MHLCIQTMHKKRLILEKNQPCYCTTVENIGFDRRKLVFGEAGIPLKNKYLFIPATDFP